MNITIDATDVKLKAAYRLKTLARKAKAKGQKDRAQVLRERAAFLDTEVKRDWDRTA